MSTKTNNYLPIGKTIGFYGDSFAVRPFRGGWYGQLNDETSSTIDKEQQLSFTYNRPEQEYDTPSDHFSYLNWYHWQLAQHFETVVHYGVSGTGPEHMIYDQIDVENNRWRSYAKDKIIPDVMICCWSYPTRLFFDKDELMKQNSSITPLHINYLNQIGNGYEINGKDNLKGDVNSIYHKLNTMLRHKRLSTSYEVQYERMLQQIITFDTYWIHKLKQRNPNVKVIHLQIPRINHINFDNETLKNILSNNVWVSNFSLDKLSGDEDIHVEVKSNQKQYINHFGAQWKHDKLYENLKYLIINYDDLKGMYLGSEFNYLDNSGTDITRY